MVIKKSSKGIILHLVGFFKGQFFIIRGRNENIFLYNDIPLTSHFIFL
jgi:hypothetical protein